VTDKPATISVLPDEVLSAILSLAKRVTNTPRFEFRAHDSALQEIFQDLSRKSGLVSQFFVFSNSGPTPYSPVLNESIAKLQLSGLLGRENPDYEVVFLRPAADSYFDEVLKKRFKREELEELQQVAESFAKQIQAA